MYYILSNYYEVIKNLWSPGQYLLTREKLVKSYDLFYGYLYNGNHFQ